MKKVIPKIESDEDYRFDFEKWLKKEGAWDEFYKYADFELLNGQLSAEDFIMGALHYVKLEETDSGWEYWIDIQKKWERVLFRLNMIKIPLPKEKVGEGFIPTPLKLDESKK